MNDDIQEAAFHFAYDPDDKLFIASGVIEGKRVMGMGVTVKDALIAAFQMAHPETKNIQLPANLEMDNPFEAIEDQLT